MIFLLEAGHGDQTGAIVVGVVVFAMLLSLLAILMSFGAARPHATSE